MKRLGVNIDHVATLRNARGETHPDPVSIAKFVKNSGADSITIHLREDRRHINDNDAKKMIEEFRDFDATIKEIIKFINKNKNTLLIVTADHETGGLQILKRSKNSIKVQWSTGSHTAAPVGVFSYGPGAEIFEGTMDNTDIHNKILNLLSFNDLEDNSCKY